MRLLRRYLIFSGIALHLVVLGVFFHMRSTALLPFDYVTKVAERLDQSDSPARHAAAVLRFALIDSGFLENPSVAIPRTIAVELPRWRGLGANDLRRDTRPRYTQTGNPVSMDDVGWDSAIRPAVERVQADSLQAVRQLLSDVRPGTEIQLAAGVHVLDGILELRTDARPGAPLILRGDPNGTTIIEASAESRIALSGRYWTLSDLVLRGTCGTTDCGPAVTIGPSAQAATLRNLFASGLSSLVDTHDRPNAASTGLLDGITVVGGRASTASQGLQGVSIRELALPGNFVVLCPTGTSDAQCDSRELQSAVDQAGPGGVVLIRSGIYRQAARLNHAGLHLIAEPGARLFGTSTGRKGALVVGKAATIEGLTCSHIKVRDGNGACVRQDRGDVTLIGVHFHHAQMGILTGHEGGHIRIIDSYLHDSGYDESGQLGHNIYVNSGRLEFVRSWSLSARNAGHELKSRAEATLVRDSFIASLNARDSRLVDVPDAGELTIEGSILGEGPRSENGDVIGYGLEIRSGSPRHRVNTIELRGNTVYVDRTAGANLLNQRFATSVNIRANVIVGSMQAPAGNEVFATRADAGTAPYPAFESMTF
jgi:hypothetical protein